MNEIDRFLICCDLLIEDDIEYILHTQQPRVLFKVYLKDPDNYESVDFKMVQEYDRFADFSQKQIDEFMEAMRDWYIDVRKEYAGEDLFIDRPPPEEFSYAGLDDAYFMLLMNNEKGEIPKQEEIDAIEELDYVRVSKNGEMFWCKVWNIDKLKNTLFVIIYQELLLTPIHGLKGNDGIIIEHHHIYEIGKSGLA